jgi:hypothetical protein
MAGACTKVRAVIFVTVDTRHKGQDSHGGEDLHQHSYGKKTLKGLQDL